MVFNMLIVSVLAHAKVKNYRTGVVYGFSVVSAANYIMEVTFTPKRIWNNEGPAAPGTYTPRDWLGTDF